MVFGHRYRRSGHGPNFSKLERRIHSGFLVGCIIFICGIMCYAVYGMIHDLLYSTKPLW